MADSAEISGSQQSRFYQREKRYFYGQEFQREDKNFTGENFWACGHFVSSVGLDEEMIRKYIPEQETESGKNLARLIIAFSAPVVLLISLYAQRG